VGLTAVKAEESHDFSNQLWWQTSLIVHCLRFKNGDSHSASSMSLFKQTYTIDAGHSSQDEK
jgi:hypothetical protein